MYRLGLIVVCLAFATPALAQDPGPLVATTACKELPHMIRFAEIFASSDIDREVAARQVAREFNIERPCSPGWYEIKEPTADRPSFHTMQLSGGRELRIIQVAITGRFFTLPSDPPDTVRFAPYRPMERYIIHITESPLR